MKNLLVATDFSDAADNAVTYAARLARELKAELTLFNAFKPDVHTANSRSSSAALATLKKHNEERLAELAAQTSTLHELAVHWRCVNDSPIDRLAEYAAQHPVELVVMGIESNLPEYKLFGNTTTAAIKLRRFPVLVVPNGVTLGGLKRVLYACDPARVKDGSELALLAELLAVFHAQLDVLHVFEKDRDEAMRQRVEQLVETALPGGLREYRYFTHQKVDAGIRECVHRFTTELLVMLSHELGFWESITTGSHTRQMTVTTRVPLLVLPGGAR